MRDEKEQVGYQASLLALVTKHVPNYVGEIKETDLFLYAAKGGEKAHLFLLQGLLDLLVENVSIEDFEDHIGGDAFFSDLKLKSRSYLEPQDNEAIENARLGISHILIDWLYYKISQYEKRQTLSELRLEEELRLKTLSKKIENIDASVFYARGEALNRDPHGIGLHAVHHAMRLCLFPRNDVEAPGKAQAAIRTRIETIGPINLELESFFKDLDPKLSKDRFNPGVLSLILDTVFNFETTWGVAIEPFLKWVSQAEGDGFEMLHQGLNRVNALDDAAIDSQLDKDGGRFESRNRLLVFLARHNNIEGLELCLSPAFEDLMNAEPFAHASSTIPGFEAFEGPRKEEITPLEMMYRQGLDDIFRRFLAITLSHDTRENKEFILPLLSSKILDTLESKGNRQPWRGMADHYFSQSEIRDILLEKAENSLKLIAQSRDITRGILDQVNLLVRLAMTPYFSDKLSSRTHAQLLYLTSVPAWSGPEFIKTMFKNGDPCSQQSMNTLFPYFQTTYDWILGPRVLDDLRGFIEQPVLALQLFERLIFPWVEMVCHRGLFAQLFNSESASFRFDRLPEELKCTLMEYMLIHIQPTGEWARMMQGYAHQLAPLMIRRFENSNAKMEAVLKFHIPVSKEDLETAGCQLRKEG